MKHKKLEDKKEDTDSKEKITSEGSETTGDSPTEPEKVKVDGDETPKVEKEQKEKGGDDAPDAPTADAGAADADADAGVDVKLELTVQKLADAESGVFNGGGGFSQKLVREKANTEKGGCDDSGDVIEDSGVPTDQSSATCTTNAPVYSLSTTNFIYVNKADFDQLCKGYRQLRGIKDNPEATGEADDDDGNNNDAKDQGKSKTEADKRKDLDSLGVPVIISPGGWVYRARSIDMPGRRKDRVPAGFVGMNGKWGNAAAGKVYNSRMQLKSSRLNKECHTSLLIVCAKFA
jgi:hypothetical protein